MQLKKGFLFALPLNRFGFQTNNLFFVENIVYLQKFLLCVAGDFVPCFVRSTVEMIDQNELKRVIEPLLEKENLFLVEVSVSPDNRVVVTLDGDKGVSIDSCVNISRAIESAFDRDKEDFELEVTSAGLGQPLKLPRQYQKYLGKELEVVLKSGEKLTGTLQNADESGFTLSVTRKVAVEGKKKPQPVTQQLDLLYSNVKTAKVVIKFR